MIKPLKWLMEPLNMIKITMENAFREALSADQARSKALDKLKTFDKTRVRVGKKAIFTDPGYDTSKTDYTEILKMLVKRGKTEKEIMDFALRDLANEKSENEINLIVTNFFKSQQDERLEIPDFLKRNVKEGLDDFMGDNAEKYQNTEEGVAHYAKEELQISQPKIKEIFNGRTWLVIEEASQKAYVINLNSSPPSTEDVDYEDALAHFTNDGMTEMASGGATGAGAIASVSVPLGGMQRRKKTKKK